MLRVLALPACLAAFGATALPAHASLGFATPTSASTPDRPEGLALADFDEDGILDVAVGNRDAIFPTPTKEGGVAVLRGGPSGLTPFAASPVPTVNNLPIAVRAADLNGDGHQDLVSAAAVGGGGSSIAVALGDGAGAFTAAPGSPYPTTIDGPAAASGLALADITGDGKLDAIVGDAAHVALLSGSGTGAFGTPALASLDFGTADSLALADVVGDARPDVIATGTSGLASIFKTTDAGLEFSFLTVGAGQHVIGANADEAGRDDLIFSRIAGDKIATYLSTGDGTLAPPLLTSTSSFFVNEMARADLDADGHGDLAVAANAGLPVLRGAPDGSLTPLPGGPLALAGQGLGVALGDVTGDAQPDVVYSDSDNDIVHVAPNTNVAAAGAPASVDFATSKAGDPPVERTITLTSTGSGFLRTSPAATTGPFSIVSDGCSGESLAVGKTCDIVVRLTPSTPGAAAASLTVPGNTAAPTIVALSATISAPPVVTPLPVRDTTRPVVSAVRLTRTRFAVAKSPTATLAATKRGTQLTYTISEASRVSFRIQRIAGGRRKGGRCVAPAAARRTAKACTRYVAVGTITRNAVKAGANRLAFSGRIGQKALRTGRYRVAIEAVDAAGNRSSAVKPATFRVVTAR